MIDRDLRAGLGHEIDDQLGDAERVDDVIIPGIVDDYTQCGFSPTQYVQWDASLC